jgi:hypothetical protein
VNFEGVLESAWKGHEHFVGESRLLTGISQPLENVGFVLNADKIFALAYSRVLYILENYVLNE